MAVRIVTDATTDLPLSYIKEHNVVLLSYPVEIGGAEYRVGPDETEPGNISVAEFHKLIAAGERATTAQIPLDTYLNVFRSILENGDDGVYMCFSSGLSGTYNTARLACEELSEEFPNNKILVVDTLAASYGEGKLVADVVEKYEQENCSAEELAAYGESLVQKMNQWFTVNDLHYLAKGGRLSGSAAFVGTLLSVKPVLEITAEGKLVPREKLQGRKKALKALADKYLSHGANIGSELHITHAGCEEDALFVKRYVEEKGGKVAVVEEITPVIVAHTGLGVVALFYYGDENRKA